MARFIQRAAKGEMLVVASAVGVASCFGAPISGELTSPLSVISFSTKKHKVISGTHQSLDSLSSDLSLNVSLCSTIIGVLFSVEVMGTHYSVRDYCPCFFAAACGAITFRLLSVCSRDQGERFTLPTAPPNGCYWCLSNLIHHKTIS